MNEQVLWPSPELFSANLMQTLIFAQPQQQQQKESQKGVELHAP